MDQLISLTGFLTGRMNVVWVTRGLKETLREEKSYDRLKNLFFHQGDRIWLERVVEGILDLDLYGMVVVSYRGNRSIPDHRINPTR